MIRVKTIRYVSSLDNFNDIVIQLDWEYSLEGFQTISGTLDLPAPSPETFIPIEDLEQSIMVEWVELFVNPASMQLLPVIEDVVINTISFE
jgi:hypothetical protein